MALAFSLTLYVSALNFLFFRRHLPHINLIQRILIMREQASIIMCKLKDLWLNLFLFFRNLIYAILWKTFRIARACSALTKTCLTWFLYGGISTKSGLRGTAFYSQGRRHLLTPNWKTLLRYGSFSLFVFIVVILKVARLDAQTWKVSPKKNPVEPP